ncbi:MAG: hypothetical protein KDD46_04885 [Bdellovibrionales bacterium]|nr:hypothetical protein [Bdellovibrionales bacterium]
MRKNILALQDIILAKYPRADVLIELGDPLSEKEIYSVQKQCPFELDPSMLAFAGNVASSITVNWSTQDQSIFDELSAYQLPLSGNFQWSLPELFELNKSFFESKQECIQESDNASDEEYNYYVHWLRPASCLSIANGEYYTSLLDPDDQFVVSFLAYHTENHFGDSPYEFQSHGQLLAKNFEDLIRRLTLWFFPDAYMFEWSHIKTDFNHPLLDKGDKLEKWQAFWNIK